MKIDKLVEKLCQDKVKKTLGTQSIYVSLDEKYSEGVQDCYDLIKADYIEKTKVEKLVEALRFYADKDNWDTNHYCPTIWSDGDIDLGKVASQALTEFEK